MKKSNKTLKVILIALAIFVVLVVIAAAMYSWGESQYKSQFSKYEQYHIVTLDNQNNLYTNDSLGVEFAYPKYLKGPVAPSETGDIAEFFFPNSPLDSIENIGFDVSVASSTDGVLQEFKKDFSENGPLEVKSVQFGGQNGYRVAYIAHADKNSGNLRTLIYFTVKNGMSYSLGYEVNGNDALFNKDSSVIDAIASSFAFIKGNASISAK